MTSLFHMTPKTPPLLASQNVMLCCFGLDLRKLQCSSYASMYGFGGDETDPKLNKKSIELKLAVNLQAIAFLFAPHVKTIWRKIWSWWNLANLVSFPSFDVLDISMNKIADLGCSRLNKVIHGVFQCGLWAIWKWRIKLVHASLDDRPKYISVHSMIVKDLDFSLLQDSDL
ncbi:hypothetical protein Tco_0940789 [Tanacetum coccineum]|uniref:Uncharacterized protein n=1 Tax=Tanacetum coccineum TaxID=301880 RepID=A0ABQ5DPG3_9ASTR